MNIKESYFEMIDALTVARNRILLIDNMEIKGLIQQVVMPITSQINSMSVKVGLPVSGELEYVRTKPGEPIIRMLGKDVSFAPKIEVTVKEFAAINKQSSIDNELEVLRKKVADLYPLFLTLETASILDVYDELTIKGVAKIAGLPVSENSPKVVDAKFVEIVKEAIKKSEIGK